MALSRLSGWLRDRSGIRAFLATLTLPPLATLLLVALAGSPSSSELDDKLVLVRQTPPVAPQTVAWFAQGYAGEPQSGQQGDPASTRQALPTVHAGSPLASPILDADLNLLADRAQVWTEGKEQMLLLDRQVSFTMGTYGFKADKALIRIETEPQVGRTIRHVWMVLHNARPLRGRGPLQGEAGRLLVTTMTTGQVGLLTHHMVREKPTDDPFILAAHQRFSQYAWGASQPVLPVPDGQPVAAPEALAMRDKRRAELAKLAQQYRSQLPPERLAALEREEARPTRPAAGAAATQSASAQPAKQDRIAGALGTDRRGMILPTTGAVLFQYDRVAVQPMGEDELALVFMGNVSVVYEPTEGGQGMSLTSTNAVVFVRRPEGVRGDLPNTQAASAQDIRGVYLEDNVQATNGKFTVRAPRVYYDLTRNKAVVLDAVMHAYDARRQLPIYVRADKLRQESLNSWTANNASLTTSEFAEPTLSIGARQVTFTHDTAADGQVNQPFVAKDAAVRLGKMPVFVWPSLGGDVQASLPIRRADVGFRSSDGPILRTQWDLFALAGKPQPKGVDLTGSLDWVGQRGPGIGVELEYDLPNMFGLFDGYLLAYDQGEDRIGGRDHVDHDGDQRGFYRWQHRQQIRGGWELSLESAVVTDETFLEEFFPSQATTSKPWETSVYLKKQQDDWAFTFLGSYDLNTFAPQTTTLQAPGYRVDKLPELGYYRVGSTFWDNRLTYYGETTLSRMRMRFGSDKPSDRGFDDSDSLFNFGIPSDLAYGDVFRDAGFDPDWRTRFDSRHEIQAPMKWGFINAVPYISGRITAYDDDFDDYAGETDNARFFGTAGVRLHTQFHRTFDQVESRVLNLHRLRHIVEPMADLGYAYSTYNPEDVPVYDNRVEALQEGASFRFGFRNTLQTQRGGEGRWRSVDWLTVNTFFVVRSDDANNAIIPRYYGYRPEFGPGGDHFHTDAMWMISDTLAAVGELIYDFEEDQAAYWRTGLVMEHSPVLTTFLQYTDIDSLSSRLLTAGFNYKLTRKWTAGTRYTYDVARSRTRDIELTMLRELSDWRMVLTFNHDAIDNRQSFSIVLMPNFISSYRRNTLFGPVLAD